MFQQVHQLLNNFLRQLSYIYKTNNINHSIMDYEKAIFRMIAPTQILINNQFQSEQDSYFDQFGKIQYNNRSQQTKKIRSKMKESSFNNDIENQIVHWALNEVLNGTVLTKQIIIDKARQCAAEKHIRFETSNKWYSCFVKRNSKIKEIIWKQKKILQNRLQKSEDDSSQKVSLQQSSTRYKYNYPNNFNEPQFQEVINPKRKQVGWNFENYTDFSIPTQYGNFSHLQNFQTNDNK